MARHKKKNVLTLEQKIVVFEGISSKESQRALTSRFCCSESQIQRPWNNNKIYEKPWADNANKVIKIDCTQKFQMISYYALDWYGNALVRGLPINAMHLKQSTRQIAEKPGVVDFFAGSGWS